MTEKPYRDQLQGMLQPTSPSLTFDYTALAALWSSAVEHWALGVRTLYEDETGQGFWLVGDDGVYLMHNGYRADDELPMVVYATECNPKTMPFDDWWTAKRETFGGDDGVEFIEAEIVRQAIRMKASLQVVFDGDSMGVNYLVQPQQ